MNTYAEVRVYLRTLLTHKPVLGKHRKNSNTVDLHQYFAWHVEMIPAVMGKKALHLF
jgi:hypothetical protein